MLRGGGQLLLNVWGSMAENPVARVAHETVSRFFASDPPTFYEVLFGFHDRPELRRLLEGAGFTSIAIRAVELEGVAPSAEHAAIGLVRGSPVAYAIEERGSAPADVIVATVASALAAEFGDHPLRVPMRAVVAEAKRPDVHAEPEVAAA